MRLPQMKCDVYWPLTVGTQTVYGNVTVVTLSCDVYADYTNRTFRVSCQVINNVTTAAIPVIYHKHNTNVLALYYITTVVYLSCHNRHFIKLLIIYCFPEMMADVHNITGNNVGSHLALGAILVLLHNAVSW